MPPGQQPKEFPSLLPSQAKLMPNFTEERNFRSSHYEAELECIKAPLTDLTTGY